MQTAILIIRNVQFLKVLEVHFKIRKKYLKYNLSEFLMGKNRRIENRQKHDAMKSLKQDETKMKRIIKKKLPSQD